MKNALILAAAVGVAFLVGTKVFGTNPKEIAGTVASGASDAMGCAKKKASNLASHAKGAASKATSAAETVAHDAGGVVKDVASDMVAD